MTERKCQLLMIFCKKRFDFVIGATAQNVTMKQNESRHQFHTLRVLRKFEFQN